MISLLLLIILFFGFLRGLKRGFILQLMHLVSFVIAFIVAILYYKKFASHLVSWVPYPELPSDHTWAVFVNSMSLENAFYNAIAFAMIFFGVKIILHIIASMLDFVSRVPLLRQANKWLGGILGFAEIYLVMFIVLYIFALLPVSKVQGYLEGSFIATQIVEHTPFLSSSMQSLWFTEMLGKVF